MKTSRECAIEALLCGGKVSHYDIRQVTFVERAIDEAKRQGDALLREENERLKVLHDKIEREVLADHVRGDGAYTTPHDPKAARIKGAAAQRLRRKGVMNWNTDGAYLTEIGRYVAMRNPATEPIGGVCQMGRYCSLHDSVHGLETEELRSRLEKLIEDGPRRISSVAIQRILDEVDARDSVAYLEKAGG